MVEGNEEPIPLEGEEGEPLPLAETGGDVATNKSPKIQAFGGGVARAKVQKEFKRPLNLTGSGAVRCRIFNSKITVAAMDHMVDQINEWLDANEIEVKAVNQVVGTLEGKTAEPNVIVTVWY